MLRLLVDFNAVRDGLVRGLLEDASGPGEITRGQRVLLDDDEGTQAVGVISHIEGELVFAGVLEWGNSSQAETVTETIESDRYHPQISGLRVEGAERQLEPA